MKNSNRKSANVILGLGVLTGLIIALARKAEATPKPPPTGALTIKLYNQYGRIIDTLDSK